MEEAKNLNPYDDKIMKYIDIVFENCEVYRLDANMIDYADFTKTYDDLVVNYNGLKYSKDAGEVMSHTYCTEVFMTINEKGLQKVDGFTCCEDKPLIERLKFNDITGFDIYFTDNTHIYIICPWDDDNGNEYRNACMHVKGNEKLTGIQIKRGMTEEEIKEFEKDFEDYNSFSKAGEEMFESAKDMAKCGCSCAEVGHMLFSNNVIFNKSVSELLKAALNRINDELCRVMWNRNQEEYDSPFENSGNSFTNDIFEVHAYNWDEDVKQKYNFKWRDYKIIWYKYFDRDMSINKEMSLDTINEMLEECLQSIREMDVCDDEA